MKNLRHTPLALIGCALVACGGAAKSELPPSPPAAPNASPALDVPADKPAAAPVADKPVAVPALPPITLSAGEASAMPKELPTTKFIAPTALQVIAADKAESFVVKPEVKNWVPQTGAAHVHLILDNKPYKALFDLKVPVTLGELAGGPLSEGEHTLVMFPSRMNHESVKSKGAISSVSFFVGKKSALSFDAKKGSLIFSRPKGEYKGDAANHVLVDFQLLNIELGAGKYSVQVDVTGPGIDAPLTHTSTSFGAPLYLDGLRTGKYTVKTELLGKDGKPVGGNWNSTTREITINREAPSEPAHVHIDVPAPVASPDGPPKPPVGPIPKTMPAKR